MSLCSQSLDQCFGWERKSNSFWILRIKVLRDAHRFIWVSCTATLIPFRSTQHVLNFWNSSSTQTVGEGCFNTDNQIRLRKSCIQYHVLTGVWRIKSPWARGPRPYLSITTAQFRLSMSTIHDANPINVREQHDESIWTRLEIRPRESDYWKRLDLNGKTLFGLPQEIPSLWKVFPTKSGPSITIKGAILYCSIWCFCSVNHQVEVAFLEWYYQQHECWMRALTPFSNWRAPSWLGATSYDQLSTCWIPTQFQYNQTLVLTLAKTCIHATSSPEQFTHG